MDSITKALRHHSIVEIWLHHSKQILAIVIGGSNYLISVLTLETEGDCCSESWVEHISNPDACHMARFERWVETDIQPEMESLSENERAMYTNGELKFYYYEIHTDKGVTTIEMRNESNGYYGGWIKYGHISPYLDWDPDPQLWTKVA